jgi:N6-L-threonylcarbamoyladenine synthase
VLREICGVHGAKFFTVPKEYSGDCGAQIAWNGLQAFEAGVRVDVSGSSVKQSWRLDEVDVKWRSS